MDDVNYILNASFLSICKHVVLHMKYHTGQVIQLLFWYAWFRQTQALISITIPSFWPYLFAPQPVFDYQSLEGRKSDPN